jgi:hypothetical protein
MYVRTAPHALALGVPRVAPRQASSIRPSTALALVNGWIERLAAWSDRQPMHHHLGSWTRL